MDLYRTLRISLYLLAGTGAFAISVAERSFFYLVLIAVLAVVSFFTIDRGKARPISAELTAGLTLVLLYLALRPLHDDEHWQANFPAAVAHFLCAWQGVLFFSVYGGPVLLTYCGSTLAVVVMSGVMQPGPSLAARVGCFVAVAIWTLYIHALWRSRQEFAGLPAVLHAADPAAVGERPGAETFTHLPQGSFWATLAVVGGMTLACFALGLAVFFSVPRMDGILAFFEKRGAASENPGSGALLESGRTGRDSFVSGAAENVSLHDLGRIELNGSVALRAVFSKPVALLAAGKNRILLKSLNFSEYRGGDWITEKARETVESKAGSPVIVPRDPSLDGPVFHGEEVDQTIEASALHSSNFFTAGALVRIHAARIEVDAEGAVRDGTGTVPENYTLTVSAPFDAGKLPEKAAADHRQVQRYVRQNGLPPSAREAVEQLARQITAGAASDAAKALAIKRWLERNRGYTINLDRIHPAGDPLAHFLLTRDPAQQRGHCGLFASAFVVLCRANNLPARLCIGYSARIDPADGDAKTVVAHNSDAHAWGEIYFKNIGWVPYDPTPSASEAIIAAEMRALQTAPPAQAAAAVPSIPEKELSQGVVQDGWQTILDYNGYSQRKLYEKLMGAPRVNAGSNDRGWANWIGIALAWAGTAAAFGWLVHFFSRRGARRRLASDAGGPRARAAVAFYNDLLQALSRRGYARRPGQTPREFADAVLRRGGEAYAPVRDVTAIFEAVRYGGGELEQDEFNRLQDALDKIKEMTF